ncbi:MAG: O-antigen ligase family protein [Lunatimonas sp.]|uniref:O-antigen ligase family protein n=1 Tax=Lunatimonas sp. TaxID=2060141 RepID=UPI00263AB3AC|nr:O-antigen ligase family protein [Lunatimonas sp.]MCC5938449.1 O-antigen ligase family protein [Lunatimonas sp.]
MLFVIVVIGTVFLAGITFRKIILKGQWEFVIFFAALFFPFYITILSIVYTATRSTLLLTAFQSIKELVIGFAVLSFFIFQRDLARYPFRLITLDWLFVAFYAFAFMFLVLPIGEAELINKVLYFKNMVLMGVFYFFGRNTRFSDDALKQLLHLMLGIGLLAFSFNLVEYAIDTHFQQFTGYALFNEQVNEVVPRGNYGLTWTFETQTLSKRFASFFADPLELAISSLMLFSIALIMYLTTPRERAYPYLILVGVTLGTLMFSSSRSSLAALMVLALYIAFVFKLHKVLVFAGLFVVLFVLYFFYLASEDFQYFVIDTITFQNTSSVGHLLEWTAALESMIASPFGIGLATSGNVGAVDDSLRVGGENQFLVFGVQLGWIGMAMYLLILAISIVYAYRAFSELKNVQEARIAFVATSVKFAMIFPLFTSNAEKFFFVSLISWWMVGYTVHAIHRQRLNATLDEKN